MVSIPAGYVRATEQNWSNVVYPGVYIEDTDVSGKSLTEVEQLLNTKYIDDPDRYEDETEVVKKPSAGYKVKVYRKTYENGKLINTKPVSTDNYRKVDGEIMRGTKKRT